MFLGVVKTRIARKDVPVRACGLANGPSRCMSAPSGDSVPGIGPRRDVARIERTRIREWRSRLTSACGAVNPRLSLPLKPGYAGVQTLSQVELLEEVVALVIDDDEGREILDLDAPDRLHP